jgi:nucleotide-binding universal stress UspA family protein
MTERSYSKQLIIAAIDGSPQSLAALEAAARISASLNARLRAMFVEDINLLRSAELPFTRVVASSGEARSFTIEDVERELHRLEHTVRAAVEKAAERFGILWTFDVVRGAVVGELVRAAAEADVVTVGRSGWSRRGPKHLGSVTRSLVAEGPASVLLVETGAGIEGPVVVLYGESETAQRGLDLAIALARQRPTKLTVVLYAADPAPLELAVRDRLSAAGLPPNSWSILDTRRTPLPDVVRRIRPGLVITPREAAAAMEEIHCSTFIVR